ncbi:tetratricopeptide repeat protein [Acidisphaera sp. L21]|uniref:tetratricopeptide repeat protein n=1 Tax=Acidisphaera sp. L21 TaxID=1641851 RepID=UPI00210F5F50|nr:tetratricopeptide repeat protein [Acidisphaera sp. L21]
MLSLQSAIRCFNAGDLQGSASILVALLEQQPVDPRGLLLLALVRYDEGGLAEARELFLRYLVLNLDDGLAWLRLGQIHQRLGADPQARACFARTVEVEPDNPNAWHEYGAVLFRLGEHEAAVAALDTAVALAPGSMTTQCNRAKLLASLHRPEADPAFNAVLALHPHSASDWHDRATACLYFDDATGAAHACRHGLGTIVGLAPDAAPTPMELQLRLLLAECLERAGHFADAQTERADVGRRQGVMVQPCLGEAPAARLLLLGGAGSCNLPTDFMLDRNRFEIVTLFLPPNEAADHHWDTIMAQSPPIGIAFNIIGDADAGAPFLAQAESLLRRFPYPVLNPPWQIPPTRRDRLPERLTGIAGLVVPFLVRMSRDEVLSYADAVEGQALQPPLLLRPVGLHGGEHLQRLSIAQQLTAAASTAAPGDYYLSHFHDFRGNDGRFRKYRLVFIGNEIFPVHLAIGNDWLVHYWRTAMSDAMRHEETAFLANPVAAMGATAFDALRAVVRRLDLDYGGVDCAVLVDGRLLLFEANATMLVHATGVFPEKRRQAERIRDALSAYILLRQQAALSTPVESGVS